MRLLLDTNILIWAVDKPSVLDLQTQSMLRDQANDVHFSAASIWEIAIKAGLGKSGFAAQPDVIAEAAQATGFIELPVSSRDAIGVQHLPAHHKDPFDRLLIAQALAGPYQFLTSDSALAAYSPLVSLVMPIRT
ncbi:MAG: type II toxin-antitoxin system VapC family toxin [Elsteraceae bacterium]